MLNQNILEISSFRPKKLKKGSKTPNRPFMEILNLSHKITRYILKYVFGIMKKIFYKIGLFDVLEPFWSFLGMKSANLDNILI